MIREANQLRGWEMSGFRPARMNRYVETKAGLEVSNQARNFTLLIVAMTDGGAGEI
jgi:hypothetical protein